VALTHQRQQKKNFSSTMLQKLKEVVDKAPVMTKEIVNIMEELECIWAVAMLTIIFCQ
jgi:hypothetical protein